MLYTTQMDAAKKGIVTKEMLYISEQEGINTDELLNLIANGHVAVPCNKNHTSLSPKGIGNRLKTKINVNLGASKDCMDINVELEKVNGAQQMGADAIMDISTFGDTRGFRKQLVSQCSAMLGTVPIYDALVYFHRACYRPVTLCASKIVCDARICRSSSDQAASAKSPC